MKIIDFTKKGTKLPVIPVGTEFRTVNCDKSSSLLSQEILEGYSFGTHNEKWLKVDQVEYKGFNHYLIKLSTIERLAKEQGMCESECNVKVSLNEDTVNALRYLLTAIERKPKLEINFNPIKPSWIFEEFKNYKSQQMNPKVTLQQNGTVTVTDTETTTTLSKVTVDEIFRLVKEENDKPNFKPNLGDWCHYMGGLYVWNDGEITYGFNHQGRYGDKYLFSVYQEAAKATPETVEQYLKAEAVKRGYKKGVKVKRPNTFVNKGIAIIEHNEFKKLGVIGFQIGGVSIFEKGVWATIIQPETITRAEAEKQLGKVITD